MRFRWYRRVGVRDFKFMIDEICEFFMFRFEVFLWVIVVVCDCSGYLSEKIVFYVE